MSAVAVALAVVCLLVLITGLARLAGSDAWVVLAAHNGPWAVALLVWASGVIRYSPAAVTAMLILAGGVLAFNLGVLLNQSSRPRPTPDVRAWPTITMRAYCLLWVGYALGLGSLLLTISRYFGLVTLFTSPQTIRTYSDVRYLEAFPLPGKLLFYLGPLLMVLTANPGFVSRLAGKPKVLLAALYLVLVISQFASLQRTNIFVGIAWSVAVLLFSRARAAAERTRTGRTSRVGRPRKGLAAAAAVVAAVVIFQILGNALGKDATSDPRFTPYLSSRISQGPAATMLVYGSSGVAGFLTLTQSENHAWPSNSQPPVFGDYNPVTHGAATFAIVPKFLPLYRPWPEVGPFISVPFPTNVYTWLDPWYRDFRAPGVLLITFLVGFWATSIVRRRDGSPRGSLLAGLVLMALIWAPFTNRLFSTMTIELWLVVYVITRVRFAPSTAESELAESVLASR